MNPQQTADDGSSDGGVGDQQTSELFFGPAETLTLSQTLDLAWALMELATPLDDLLCHLVPRS